MVVCQSTCTHTHVSVFLPVHSAHLHQGSLRGKRGLRGSARGLHVLAVQPRKLQWVGSRGWAACPDPRLLGAHWSWAASGQSALCYSTGPLWLKLRKTQPQPLRPQGTNLLKWICLLLHPWADYSCLSVQAHALGKQPLASTLPLQREAQISSFPTPTACAPKRHGTRGRCGLRTWRPAVSAEGPSVVHDFEVASGLHQHCSLFGDSL